VAQPSFEKKYLMTGYFASSDAAKSHLAQGRWERCVFFGTMLIAASVVMRPLNVLYEAPLNEDGYYVLTVARNIGLAHGVTVDGINLTNGFQPLWVVLTAPVFTVVGGDHEWSIRFILFAHWVLFFASASTVRPDRRGSERPAHTPESCWNTLDCRSRFLRRGFSMGQFL
jgi:hypothetical protein